MAKMNNKKSVGSVRAKAGLPAKAGKRRPAHIRINSDASRAHEYVAGVSAKPLPPVEKPVPAKGYSMEHTVARPKVYYPFRELWTKQYFVLETRPVLYTGP